MAAGKFYRSKVPKRSKALRRIPRCPRVQSGIYSYRRTLSTTFTPTYNGVLTNTYLALEFQLGDLAGYTEFTTLYDSWRLKKVNLRFIPRMNSFGQADYAATFTACPNLITAIDTDDSATPTSLDDLLQYANHKIHPWYKQFSVSFAPKVATAVYGGATFSAYAQGSPWIDSASATTAIYYGLKLGTTGYAATNNGNAASWDIFVTYHIECKGVR